MSERSTHTLIGDENYRNDAVNKIRELAILLGEQSLSSPIGVQLNVACKVVESSKARHHSMFIAMLMALMKNKSIGYKGRERIIGTMWRLRRNERCPKCTQELVDLEIETQDVSHATDDRCEQCGQPLRVQLRGASD